MAYTEVELSVVCPKCRASKGVRCLEPIIWGSKYVESPHVERLQEAEKEK